MAILAWKQEKILTINDLLGRWRRVGDRFEDCVVEVKKYGTKYCGILVICPYHMKEFGWVTGDIKWNNIEKGSKGHFYLDDLSIAFNPKTKKVDHTTYYHSNLVVKSIDRLTIKGPNTLQLWEKVTY